MNRKLFTEAEYKSLLERFKGSKTDPTGIFSRRVKPKIIEILWWIGYKDKLEGAISKNEKKLN